MNKIKNYIEERIQQSKLSVSVTDLLLGVPQAKIKLLVTYKELLNHPLVTQKKIHALLKENQYNLVLNGNLADHFLKIFLKLAILTKRKFSVVVMDGFREMKKNLSNSSNVALLLTQSDSQEPHKNSL